MGWPQPQPEVVQAALDWLRAQDPRLSLDALARQLRAAGYGELEVAAAVQVRQAELEAALPPGTDLRRRAATILVVAFLGVWGIITVALVTAPPNQQSYGLGGLAAVILGGLLAPMLALGLLLVRASGKLKRGVVSAVALVLVVPFVYLAIVAGLCVASTRSFGQ